jgi:hypothetical protein
MRPLIWVSKSMEKLAATLTEMGHPISADTVCSELVKLGFSRQSNRKANESKHPDRNAQFDYINAKVVAAQAQHQPIISVDTKKKELIGNFKNGGTDYRPKGSPQRVNVIRVHHYPPGTSKWNKIERCCSATSRRTGAAGRSPIGLPWSS